MESRTIYVEGTQNLGAAVTHILNFFKVPALFIAGLWCGGMLAAFYSVLIRNQEFHSLKFMLMYGSWISICSLIPALFFAAPALRQLGKRKIANIPSAAILVVGGASVGYLLMAATFRGLEPFGVVVGSSIGLSMAVLVYPFIDIVQTE